MDMGASGSSEESAMANFLNQLREEQASMRQQLQDMLGMTTQALRLAQEAGERSVLAETIVREQSEKSAPTGAPTSYSAPTDPSQRANLKIRANRRANLVLRGKMA